MMSRNLKILVIVLGFTLSACLLKCVESKLVTGESDGANGEVGDIYGTIYNPDSTPAASAVVWLIPSGYVPVVPLVKRSLAVDSIVTNDNGHFLFQTNDKGYYNLLARGDRGIGFKDSIYVSDKVKIRLDATLENPGTVRGLVRFPFGKRDHSDIVILILGTNLYTTPEDSSGHFKTPPLTSGRYTLRLLTIESGYGFLDKEIIVTEGNSHTLHDTLFLPATGPKPIDSVTVTLDRKKLETHVSWPAFPEGLIQGYNLYRTSKKIQNQRLEPYPLKDTHYVDRVMEFDGSRVEYIVTVVDRDGQETLPSPARSIRVGSAFKEDTIRIGISEPPHIDFAFAEDAQGNFYFIDQKNLYKLDSLGKVLIKVPAQEEPKAVFTSRKGFVFMVTTPYTEPPNVRKYDASLNQLDSIHLPEISSRMFLDLIYISQVGKMYTFNRKTDILKTYDASFYLLRTDSINLFGGIKSMQVLDDTLLLQSYYRLYESYGLINRYDREMNRLSSPVLIPRIRSVFPGGDLAVKNCLLTRDGRYVLNIRNSGVGYFIIVFEKDMGLMGIKKVGLREVQVYMNDRGDIRYYDRNIGIVKLEL